MNCSITSFESLDSPTRELFSTILFLQAVVIIAINGFILYIMWSRRMHKKFAFKILFLMSILYIFTAIMSLMVYATTLLAVDKMSCIQRKILYTAGLVTSYITNTMTLFLAFDRYLRVHFMKMFNGRVEITRTRYYVISTVYILPTITQGIITGLGSTIFKQRQILRFCMAAVDTSFILVSIFFYYRSIVKLRKHQQNSRQLSSTDRDITGLAKTYFLTFLLCFVQWGACYFLTELTKSDRTRALILVSSYIVLSCTGIVNGMVFIRYAGKGRKIGDLCKNNVK
uniref:G-protein coupled receptors family 1 profile domain-containing protein n=1 Tax=Clytia hemisphaerica TaxID=252671 RepID=A0A7M5UQP6_9CNID